MAMHCLAVLNYLSRESSEEAGATDTLESSCREVVQEFR